MENIDKTIASIFAPAENRANMIANLAYALEILERYKKNSHLFAAMIHRQDKELALALADDINIIEILGEQNG
jgi:hypothetical protein